MRTLTLAVTLLTTAPAFAGYAVSPRVSVNHEEVTLADLVPGAPVEWSKVALGRAPRPGGERTLPREWLLRRAEQARARDALDVSGDVVLTRPGQSVARENVVRAVEEALAGEIGAQERVRILSVGLPGTVPSGDLQLRVNLPDGPIPSPTTLWVDVFSDGHRAGRAWARVEVFRGRPTLLLVRNVRRGQVLTAEDVEVRAGEAPWGALSDPADAVGKRMVRALRANSALLERDLEAVPVVDRGDTVLLVAKVGGVMASVPGKALESAGVGEMVRVENLSSGQTVSGLLRDGGVVAVTAGRGR